MSGLGLALATLGRWVELAGHRIGLPRGWWALRYDLLLWVVILLVAGVTLGWLVVWLPVAVG